MATFKAKCTNGLVQVALVDLSAGLEAMKQVLWMILGMGST